MSKHIAFWGAAAVLLGAVRPAAAADYYDGGDRPLAYHSRDDIYLDGGRARIEHRQDLGPADGYRRGPGPVVFDERGPDRRFDRPGYGYGDPRPVVVERPAYGYGYDRPAAFVPPVERIYGGDAPYGYGGGYRPAAVTARPAFGGYGVPDEGCTVERARSITPAGWEKTVTHRTCYRR